MTSADSASTLHAWEAIVELTGKNGVRRLPIKDFYLRAGKVDIRAEEGEIQTAILIPKASYENCFGHYIKYAMRGICIDEDENIRIGSLTSFSHITRDPIIQKYINVLGEAVDMVGGP